jgi:hypothetical protein
MWGAVKAFFSTAIPGIIKPLRVLWNEMIAFIFAIFAIILGFQVARDLAHFDGSPNKLGKLAFLGIFALVMAGYALQSFLRSKKISRS